MARSRCVTWPTGLPGIERAPSTTATTPGCCASATSSSAGSPVTTAFAGQIDRRRLFGIGPDMDDIGFGTEQLGHSAGGVLHGER